jgi:hypothetical protein
MTQPLLSNITITNTHARRGLDLGNRSAPPGGRMTRTTPARPVDVAAVFPQLAPLARTATGLHPAPGRRRRTTARPTGHCCGLPPSRGRTATARTCRTG